jgi:hypothetical protein
MHLWLKIAAGVVFGALVAGIVVYFAVAQPATTSLKDLKKQTHALTNALVLHPKMKKEIAACELTALQASCAILAWISIVDETQDLFVTGDQLPMQVQTACGV